MAIFDKIIEGALNEIGAVIVGIMVAIIAYAFGKRKKVKDKKFQMTQKAGRHSKQTMYLPSDGDVDAMQESGDYSIQTQKGSSQNV